VGAQPSRGTTETASWQQVVACHANTRQGIKHSLRRQPLFLAEGVFFTATDPRLVGFLNNRISQDVDMITLRVNYRFGGYGAPVTARY
jgi:hypothetical protein